jgi:hypothetical protein
MTSEPKNSSGIFVFLHELARPFIFFAMTIALSPQGEQVSKLLFVLLNYPIFVFCI